MTTFLCLHVNTGLQFIHDVAGHLALGFLVEVLTTAVRDDADLVLIALDSLPLRLTQPDAGKHLLSVVGEVALYDPSVVTGIAGYHLADGFAFILTEVEVLGHHGLAFTVEDGIALSILGLTPHDATGEVNIIVDLREVGQALHIVRQHTALRCRRYESIVNERYDFFDKEKMKGDFLAYFKDKLHTAYREHKIHENPNGFLERIDTIPTEKEHLSRQELITLANTPCSSEVLKKAFLFSCLTGLRKSDIEQLT